ncbi:iron-containing redox enzyme family protein [Cryptosporangium sp. NPDC051539]|uniref:iron-containing redox enzyme family protein n=1 Tax=Cryptosporangium sp. NPDC051539 TaxID=3363962 RepID=UPI0037A3E5E9
MRLPEPRGVLSESLVGVLDGSTSGILDTGPAEVAEPWLDDDLQLSLWMLYELHYRGFDGVDPDLEWDPELIRLRGGLETRFLDGVRAAVTVPEARSVAAGLTSLAGQDTGPSMSRYLQRTATLEQFREFVVHRSIYHLKEADPHSWGIPRLGGRPKAALVEIQSDEYGGGRLERMHAELFRTTMASLGLDTGYGAYLGSVSAPTLATNNLMSLFGLHRRWLGALLGHLAAYEMTSSIPNRRYGNALRRLGGDANATRFYDEHVTADAVHEQIAAHDLCGGYVEQNPAAAPDVLFGAAAGLFLDDVAASWILARWESGRSALEPHELVSPVAERLAPGLATPA